METEIRNVKDDRTLDERLWDMKPGPRVFRIPGRFETTDPDRVTYARMSLNARLCWIAGRILGGIRGPYDSRRTRAGVFRAVETLQAFRHGFRVRLSGPREYSTEAPYNGVDRAAEILRAHADMYRSRLWGPREITRARPAF